MQILQTYLDKPTFFVWVSARLCCLEQILWIVQNFEINIGYWLNTRQFAKQVLLWWYLVLPYSDMQHILKKHRQQIWPFFQKVFFCVT